MKSTHWKQSWAIAIVAILALVLACADSGPSDDAGSGGSGGVDGTGGGGGGDGGGGGGEEERCPIPEEGEIVIPTGEVDTGWEPVTPAALGEDISAEGRPAACSEEFDYIEKVRGWIVAPGGEPIPCSIAQLCITTSTDQWVCLPGSHADDEGVYTVEIPESLRCVKEVAMAVSLPLGNRAPSYCPMEPGDDPVIRIETPAVLPFALPPESLPPVGNEDEAREVVMADGLALQVTPSQFFWGPDTYERFSGRRIDIDAVGLCGEAGGFDGLYAFYPEDRIVGGGFPFTIENATELPAGANVNFYVLGGLGCKLDEDTLVPEGEWEFFGTGKVSADGSTISSDPGVGLPCTTWLAYLGWE